jgi:hypothetical protein
MKTDMVFDARCDDVEEVGMNQCCIVNRTAAWTGCMNGVGVTLDQFAYLSAEIEVKRDVSRCLGPFRESYRFQMSFIYEDAGPKLLTSNICPFQSSELISILRSANSESSGIS